MARADRFALWILTVLWVVCSSAFAAEPPATPRPFDLGANPDSVLTLTIQQLKGTPITLLDSQRLAEDQATHVRAARAPMHPPHGALRHESGAFDPELFFDADRTGSDQPTASPVSRRDSPSSRASLLR